MAIINAKINSNPRYRYKFSGSSGYADKNNQTIAESYLTKSVTDNFNVSKPIPASDHQYWWITASLVEDDRIEFPYGYATSSTGLIFISSSEYTDPLSDERGFTTNYPANLLRTDGKLPDSEGVESFKAAGYEVNQDNYIAEMNSYYSTTPTRTKVFISRMNGPYQDPSWRINTHAVLQSLKRTSNLILMDPGLTKYNGNKQIRERYGQTQTRFDIPYLSQKYKALKHGYEEITRLEEVRIVKPINLGYDYSNLLSFFPVEEIDNRLNVPDKDSLVYYSLYSKYVDDFNDSNIGDFRFIKYSEVIWPRGRNTFLGQVRNRSQFYFNWRDGRELRTINSGSNSQGHVVPTASIWPLDAREGPYRTATLFTTASTHHKGDVGELLSVSSVYHNGTNSILTASALFTYPMPDSSSAGVFFTNDTDFHVGC